MDFTRTNNPTSIFKAASHHPFPDWVANAPVPTAESLAGLKPNAFADMVKRLLPIHTKEASFFSMIDFLDHPEDFGIETGKRVKAACDSHGITNEMLPWLQEADNSFQKQASTCDWAIDTQIGDTPVRMFPLDTEENKREAVTGLTKMASEKRIDYTLLREAALTLIEKNASVNTLLADFAITRFTDPEKSAALIAGRGGNEHEQRQYNLIVKELADGGDPEQAVLKIAACDIAFDRPNHPFPSTRLRPHNLVYCGEPLADLAKQASEHVIVHDVLVPKSALAAIDPTDIEFGLSKQAGVSFDASKPDIGDIIAGWDKIDQKTLLYLALNA